MCDLSSNKDALGITLFDGWHTLANQNFLHPDTLATQNASHPHTLGTHRYLVGVGAQWVPGVCLLMLIFWVASVFVVRKSVGRGVASVLGG